jgi:hypothetical protein
MAFEVDREREECSCLFYPVAMAIPSAAPLSSSSLAISVALSRILGAKAASLKGCIVDHPGRKDAEPASVGVIKARIKSFDLQM